MPGAKGDTAVPLQSADCDWPFYARLLFAKMDDKEREEEHIEKKDEVCSDSEQATPTDTTSGTSESLMIDNVTVNDN